MCLGCVILVLHATLMIWLAGSIPLWAGIGLMFSNVLLMTGVVMRSVGLRWAFDQRRRRLEVDDWPACLYCGYPLHGLPSPYHCPECGTLYHREETQRAWKHWARTGFLPEAMPQPMPESPSRADVAP